MKISFHSYANKINFHTKSFALSLVFVRNKVQHKETRKWPIIFVSPLQCKFLVLVRLRKQHSPIFSLRGKDILTLPKVNTTRFGLKSNGVSYQAPKLWNSLPDFVRTSLRGRPGPTALKNRSSIFVSFSFSFSSS